MDKSEALKIVIETTQATHNEAEIDLEVQGSTPLIGDQSALDSMTLVQLCLALEDKAEDFGFTFDWTSDAAMSKSKGMYRSVDALADEFFKQFEKSKDETA